MIKINVFALGLSIRIVLLLTSCLAVGIVFLDPNWIFTQIILFTIIALLTIETYSFLNRTNYHLARFLESIKYDDYSTSFATNNTPKRFSQLSSEMEEIREEYKNRHLAAQHELNLYANIIESIDVGLILWNENNKATIQNNAFSSFFGLPKMEEIGDLEIAIPGINKIIEDCSDNAIISINSKAIKGYLGEDLTCGINKFKHNNNQYILLIISKESASNSGDEFETWVNFGKVISHEILNGISPIISLVSTLQNQLNKIEGNPKVTDSMQKALNIISERSESLQDYSEKYRTLHKLPEPTKEYLQWSTVINRTIDLYNKDLEEKGVSVQISGNSIDEKFKGDGWQLDQVFSNLMLNSIHAISEQNSTNKIIQIDISSNELFYIIKFSDTGIGIDPNNRSNIFMPFFTTRDSGSGIGLSVVKQILWKHGAEIFLEDNSEGTTFSIKYPKII